MKRKEMKRYMQETQEGLVGCYVRLNAKCFVDRLAAEVARLFHARNTLNENLVTFNLTRFPKCN